jgi:two-component system sensor histidine kinase PilS (NtrC family)
MLRVHLPATPLHGVFDPEHLRRVLVNLLDNARRYASRQSESIQVSGHETPVARVLLGVWSDGPPMEQSVERHLFEPFFSSESRSSGLGLYICRELCEGHGATIAYQRSKRTARGLAMEGNEFFVSFRQPSPVDTPASSTSWSFSPWH